MPISKLRYGTTDILLLALLSSRSMYGYEITDFLEDSPLQSSFGLLYPTLHRLRDDGLLDATRTDNRIYYHTSIKGLAYLKSEMVEWRTLVKFINSVLREFEPNA